MSRAIIIISIAALIGCNKQRVIVHYKITPWIKEYGAFLEGSYWVYQNDSTLETDSIWVDRVVNEETTEYSNEDLFEEKIKDEIRIYYKSLTSPYYRDSYDILVATLNRVQDEGDIYQRGWHQTPMVLLDDRLLTTDSLKSMETIVQLIDSLPAFTLNNKNYSDVLVIQCTPSDYYNSDYSWTYYLAKNQGVIKWVCEEKDCNESWSVLRWNVEQ